MAEPEAITRHGFAGLFTDHVLLLTIWFPMPPQNCRNGPSRGLTLFSALAASLNLHADQPCFDYDLEPPHGRTSLPTAIRVSSYYRRYTVDVIQYLGMQYNVMLVWTSATPPLRNLRSHPVYLLCSTLAKNPEMNFESMNSLVSTIFHSPSVSLTRTVKTASVMYGTPTCLVALTDS